MTRLANIILAILAINTGWFVAYSAALGLRGLTDAAPETLSRVFVDGRAFANAALAVHMVAGAAITLGAPLQAMPLLRRRWPSLHRRAGYALLALAAATGAGGLAYIAAQGTIGGAWMSLWFAIYGVALVWSAAAAVYFAIDKDGRRHMEWAVRFVILAVGSWIYRMHYVIWEITTGGAASNDAFTGLFDRVQVVAFFVPYLLAAEVVLRAARPRRRVPRAA